MLKFVVVLAVLGVALGLPTNSSVKDISPKLLGGSDTDIEHNPWVLALLYQSRQFCGAVEIHPFWGLTTAHCLEGVVIDHLTARAGSTTKSFGGQIVDVMYTFIHPNYNRRTVDYDFALLLFDEPITIQTASSIALPEPHQDYIPGSIATITGWGRQSSNGVSTEILRLIQVPVVSHAICQRIHRQAEVTDRMICAGDVVNEERDTCRGDEGGPAIIEGRLAGLVSWGSNCGSANSLGVLAKVSSVLEWIYQTTGPLSSAPVSIK